MKGHQMMNIYGEKVNHERDKDNIVCQLLEECKFQFQKRD
jgi:hypothetical protein